MGSYNLASELEGMSDEALGTKLHDKGEYIFVVDAAEEAETSGKNPCLRLKVSFVDGAYRGQQLTKDVIYSNRTAGGPPFFYRQLAALGLTTDIVRENPTFDVLAQLSVGAQFIGKVDHREFPPGSGDYRLDLMVSKPVSNPNTDGDSAAGATDAPVQDDRWNVEEDDVPATPAAVAAEPEAAAAEPPTAAEEADAEDPWGVTSK
jgi:hypothetical protein